MLVLLTASVVGALPLQPQRVDSGSMAPAVPTGAVVLVRHTGDQVHRRDVVTADVAGVPLVKRVVAVAGEEVAVEDGVLVVDGRPVCERDVDPDRQDGVWFGPSWCRRVRCSCSATTAPARWTPAPSAPSRWPR